jgi:hypothetical protein
MLQRCAPLDLIFLFSTFISQYTILALQSSLFLMQRQKNHQRMYCERKGKQIFYCKQTRLAI